MGLGQADGPGHPGAGDSGFRRVEGVCVLRVLLWARGLGAGGAQEPGQLGSPRTGISQGRGRPGSSASFWAPVCLSFLPESLLSSGSLQNIPSHIHLSVKQ